MIRGRVLQNNVTEQSGEGFHPNVTEESSSNYHEILTIKNILKIGTPFR